MKNLNLVFDMDGTIADLYGVPNWLDYLQAANTTPYEVAEPMVNFYTLNELIGNLKARHNVTVTVITWTAKLDNNEYHKEVAKAKKQWLKDNNFQYDKIRCVKYGTNKNTVANKIKGYDEQILFDDDQGVLASWKLGRKFDPQKINILDVVANL